VSNTSGLLDAGIGAIAALLVVALTERFTRAREHTGWQRDHLLPAVVRLLSASRLRRLHAYAHIPLPLETTDLGELKQLQLMAEEVKVLAPIMATEVDSLWRGLDRSWAAARENAPVEAKGTNFREIKKAEAALLLAAQWELGLRPSFWKRSLKRVRQSGFDKLSRLSITEHEDYV
jgi:hypothetical protein